ncbi:hypothetical protein GXP67_09440 [Rhodocytophaga rosea]|uniref:Glycosyltransferase family 39 protein n=1 Tax=Rhodocytophaga rosea TaxID=2704465 RepID=A0A6C0GG63_9BACT|nr:hypothetical protein [Rhodocytophaga rosea]QHT66865.1 hypothetical protein GXP67_09440 [Rhodocytophaga rosea]
MIVPELQWMLAGERMSRGFVLYTQTWTDVGPLAGLFYWLLDALFGRSQLAYQITAFLLVILQAVFFNFSLRRNNIYPERSNIPLLLYVLCMGLFFDFFTLSPMLMGVTFLLLALDGAFIHISETAGNDEVFSIGFYIGVATLFYAPLGIFIIYILVSFLLLAATGIRKYFLMLFGFAFAMGLTGLFFYMINGLQELYFSWLSHLLEFRKIYYISIIEFLLIASPLLALLTIASLQLVGGDTRFIHYQIRCQQTVFLWLVAAGVCLLIAPELAPYQLIIIVPGVVFFGTHFFLLVRKGWMADVAFGVLFCAVLFINFSNIFPIVSTKSWVDLSDFTITSAPETTAVKGKKVLVAGDNPAPYLYNTPATPYLQWKLAQRHFNNLDDYQIVTEIYENFRKDLPDVIVDQQGKVKTLFNRIPALARYYTQEGDSLIYTRRKASR